MQSSLSYSHQMGHPPPILQCPYDVLCIIFAYANRSTLRSLHATCKAISEVVTPLVYRHITLCNKGVPKDPRTSPFVTSDCGRFTQSCRININRHCDDTGPIALTFDFFIISLWRMPNLKSLIIWSDPGPEQSTRFWRHLADISDPPPWHLETIISNTITPSVEQIFINHNTSLKHMTLLRVRSPLLVRGPHTLPALTSLRGRIGVIRSIIPSCPVTRVHLEDPLRPGNVRELTNILSLSSVPVTQISISISLSRAFEVIHSLAEGAPNTESLIIILRGQSARDPNDVELDLRGLFLALRNFTSLHFISIISFEFSTIRGASDDISEWAPERLETIVTLTAKGSWERFSSVWNVENADPSSTRSSGSESIEARKVKSWVRVGEGKIEYNGGINEVFSDLMYVQGRGILSP